MKAELAREQRYVDLLYGMLDGMRAEATQGLAAVLRESGGKFSAITERDVAATMYADQLRQYAAVNAGLCFGSLSMVGGEHRYIGRMGILDPEDEYRSLLVDWRAPAARPFYLATAAAPDDVHSRRHIRTRLREVVAVDDEILDLSVQDHTGRGGREITGEAALLAAVNAVRTGRMGDIVQTIQAEQDRIIRADTAGVLVVQGGPGTGKTAVALHRAAYLLYTHRERLARNGVLILGPNPTFLDYISHVLPSLGETGVWTATMADLYPGITATRVEPATTAEIKGRIGMVEVIARAVRDRQRVPDEPLEVHFDRQVLTLDSEVCGRAVARGQGSGKPHNVARPLVATEIIEALTWQVADALGREFLDPGDISDIRRELLNDPETQDAVDALWPELTPQELLDDLFEDPDRIAYAAPDLTDAERAALCRAPGGWTPADVPLLYEAVELLGVDDREARARERRRRTERLAYAEGVLDILRLADDELDPDILMATDLIDASRLAGRQDEELELTTAERAAADHAWTFGHVIIDEAQELSAMAWRVVMFRCPSRSMTVVGDTAQTGDPAGTDSWDAVLSPYVADRWRLEHLTVNYRTPAEIMAVASAFGVDDDPATPVRSTGVAPWFRRCSPAELPTALADALAEETTPGRIGVVVGNESPVELVTALRAAAGDGDRVSVLTVRESKGLEFDIVIVVEPSAILTGSPRGRGDLFVALTRATQRLGVLYTTDLPPVLAV